MKTCCKPKHNKTVEHVLLEGERVEIGGFSYRVEYIQQALLCYRDWLKEHEKGGHL